MVWLLLVHGIATAYMTGLVWFVQVVHYPMFARVAADDFAAYEREHVRRTNLAVSGPMLIEAAATVGLVVAWRDRPGAWLAWVGLALLVIVWGSTVMLQVPCHRRLEKGFDRAAIDRLVQTNWWRTVAWSARSAVASVMFVHVG